MSDISKGATNRDEIGEVTRNFNKMIENYSSRTSILERYEIMGLIELVPNLLQISLPPYITVGALVWRLLNKQMEDKKAENPIVGSIFDSLNALLRVSNPHAVLIHRMRSRRAKTWPQRFVEKMKQGFR